MTKKIKKIHSFENNKTKTETETEKQTQILSSIISELNFNKNSIIHNFISSKNLKNYNIKLGIIFYSSEDVAALKNHEERISIKILAGLIYDLIINNIEFINLTPINLPSNLTPARNIRNTKTYARASFNPQDIKNHNHNFTNVKDCIAFFFYNKNLSCYKNVNDLVIEKTFSINENCININIL